MFENKRANKKKSQSWRLAPPIYSAGRLEQLLLDRLGRVEFVHHPTMWAHRPPAPTPPTTVQLMKLHLETQPVGSGGVDVVLMEEGGILSAGGLRPRPPYPQRL